MTPFLDGFAKEAGLLDGMSRLGGALKSIWSQGTGAAAAKAVGAMGPTMGTAGSGLAKAVGRTAGGVRQIGGLAGPMESVARKTIGRRMATRAGIGAAVGAGGSMLRDKARGEDVSVGRALGAGLAGGAVGGALGTTMGKRLGRSLMSPVKTPHMSLGQAANPMKWGKGQATQVASRVGTRAPIMAGGRSAFGNMSALDKAMTVQTGYEGVKALTSKEYEGHRAEGVGSALGQGAAMMTGARWGGMRKGTGSGLGHMGRTMGLYLGAGMGGSMVGKQIDKGLNKKPQNFGGSTYA